MSILNQINFRNLRGDIYGGVTAAIVALPMALAFGVASGAGAVAGLYGAVLVGFFAALFGGTPTLISEPTGPMTVIMTAVIATLTAADPENGLAMAFTVVMLAGIFQMAFGTLRLGKYITLMPYTVISGFMSGIGIILIVLQLAPFMGQATPPGGVLGTLQNLPEIIANVQPAELTLAVLTIAILFFMPSKFRRIVPPQLVALVAGTLISLLLFLTPFGDVDIRRIGAIPSGLPTLVMPTFSPEQWQTIAINALVLGMLGCIDALLTSVIADSLTRTQHNSDKELVGQGLGNLFSGMFGGLAGAGATMGTVVNIQAGGRTALSGLVRAAILLIVVLWASGLTAAIPLAVLAGIALKVGIDIIDWSFLKRAHRISWKGALIMYGVLFLTAFVDLITAVAIGVFIANILTIKRLSDIQSSQGVHAITDADDQITLTPEEKQLMQKADGRVLLFYLSGPMIFGVSKAIVREQQAVADSEILILDLSDVPHLGVTSSLALENAIRDALDRDCEVFIVGASTQSRRRLQKLGVFKRIPSENLLETRREALQRAIAHIHGSNRTTGSTEHTAPSGTSHRPALQN
jgi:sulfate permease, SulP family